MSAVLIIERGFDHRRDPAFAARAVLDFGDQGRA
jgi:hypothetical protein